MKRKEFLGRLIGEVTNFLLEGNPLRLVVSLHQEPDGAHISFFDDRPRTEEEIARFAAHHPKGTVPFLAMILVASHRPAPL